MLHCDNKIQQYHTSSAADLIKEIMKFYQITQIDLADRLGVSQKNISDILKHKRFVSEILALRIETVMGISSQLLLNLDANFKLHLAKETADESVPQNKSDNFLKRYDWVTA